ncbi:MAG TPA: hypothetical protein VFS16_07905 [Acidimicrobiia bacterium]|nr:hypothetical protein [Acidimicrobiia bacterium]
MTPLEELRADGRLGPEGARALYRTVRAVVVGHGFPPPGGRSGWTGEAVAEAAHEFLADGRTPKRLAHLLVHATDDRSFGRLLFRMVLNFLRDEGRRTEIGRLMLRLRDVLGRTGEFVPEGGDRWRLKTQPPSPSTVPPSALVEAAAAEPDVDVPRWSPQTRRRAPAADAASLERLCRRVLEAAAGTVPLDELARAVAPRLGLAPLPLAEPVDDRDPFERAGSNIFGGPQHAEGVLDSLRAAEIFAMLGRRERLLLASAGTPVRELRSVIGVGPSQAAELQGRLRALLAAELADDEGYEAVFFHLVDQAKAWAQRQEPEQATGQPDAVERLLQAT